MNSPGGKFAISIPAQNKDLQCLDGQTLLEALLEAGVSVESPCDGMGTCGKCKVRILEGTASEPTLKERKTLSVPKRMFVRFNWPKGQFSPRIDYMELAGMDGYERLFVKSMEFPDHAKYGGIK
jgi:ferredoxin